ncbi:MAG: glutamate-5-semialdehyde dehydrogenase [Planctomycetales bacterium]|nr:glutamate-5-semialdehyde dehydrogenase [Planctomycetales bacterium]
MSIAEIHDLAAYCRDVAVRAKRASQALSGIDGAVKNRWLRCSAARLRASHNAILAANAQDVAQAADFGLTDAQVDRLRLTGERIDAIATALDEIAALQDPVGEVIESSVRPNGLAVQRVRAPLGVVFFIYESRPNVTADAAAICVKSGNAVILRGGKEAAHSSQAIVQLLHSAAAECGLPQDAVQLVATADRDAVGHFLALAELIDVAIPRGGEGLIRRVAQEAAMPVIKHFSGNCHVYVDASADLEMAAAITVNAKCQRYGVCNAAESLLVHREVAETFLPAVAAQLHGHGVELRGDPLTCDLVDAAVPATEDDFYTEFLAPIMSVKVVASLEEAIEHINKYGSGHTDAIVTRDYDAARRFTAQVDSAAVVVNASTRFNDGGELGLGAEIGISTDKFHARGPCGLKELTTYKWVVLGSGQVR